MKPDWLGVILSALGLIVAVAATTLAVPGGLVALRQLRESRAVVDEQRRKRRSFRAFVSVSVVIAMVNVVCSCSFRLQEPGDAPQFPTGPYVALPDSVIASQLQSQRHQTAMSIINTMR